MGFSFNPFTGNFDLDSKTNPAGLTTEVQFNDAGAFSGDSTFTFNKTTKKLSVGLSGTLGNYFEVQAGTRKVTLGNLGVSTAFAGISFADTPSSANYSVLGDGTSTYLNAPPAGTLHLRINNSSYAELTSSKFQVKNALEVYATSPTLTLEANAIDALGAGTILFKTLGGAEYVAAAFNANANKFYMSYGTTEAFNINSSGQFLVKTGSKDQPGYSFIGASSTGLHFSGTNNLTLTRNGIDVAYIDSANTFWFTGGDLTESPARFTLTTGGVSLDFDGAAPTEYESIAAARRIKAIGDIIGTHGFVSENTTDYVETSFVSQASSIGGGLYGEGCIYLKSGIFGDKSSSDINFLVGKNTYGPGSFYLTCEGALTGYNAGNLNFSAGGADNTAGGYIILTTGSSNSTDAGALTINTGNTSGTNSSAGDLSINLGSNTTAGIGGDYYLYAGAGFTAGGAVVINSGTCVDSSGYGQAGDISIQCGSTYGYGTGASVTITSGGSSYGNAGAINITTTSGAYGQGDLNLQGNGGNIVCTGRINANGGLYPPDYTAVSNPVQGMQARHPYSSPVGMPVWYDGSGWLYVHDNSSV